MLSDEEKEEALSETEIRFRADLLILNSEFPTHRKTEAMEELLEIYNKQSKEIEEYKKQLDLDYVDKHFVPIERYNQLEKEIEELKEESKEYQIGFAQGCYEKDLDWEDKIKAKIEELDYNDIGNFERRCKQEVLQSLLEEKE